MYKQPALLMTFFSARLQSCLRAASRTSIPQIPHTCRCITTGRPHIPSFPRPPPARRNFEPAPLPISSASINASTKPQRDDTHPALARRLTNRQIPFSRVYVLDPDTQKRSATKHSLENLLVTYTQGPQRRVIELVTTTPDPIVRVTTRADIEARYKTARRALKQGARVGESPKEVQLTWGVAPADVAHKLRKAGRDLDKGYRVVVIVTVKRGHRPSSRQELVAFADEIAGALVGSGEEWKEREITDRLMVLSFRKVEADGDAM